MVIWFNSEKARKQLVENNVVVTCRKERKSYGITSAIYKRKGGNTQVIGSVKVEFLEESIDEQREHSEPFENHIELSGFESVEDWKEEVKRLNSNRWMPQYLIFLKVSLLE